MNLTAGTEVVYGTHGIGRVVELKTMTVSGTRQEVVVVELQEGLTVTLPMTRAQEQLRPIASKADLARVRKVLQEDRALSSDPWLSRRRDAIAKLTAGDPVELAELVGDGAQRERALRASGRATQLSPGEREVFMKARRLLSDEVARSRGVDADAAESWIDQQLSRD